MTVYDYIACIALLLAIGVNSGSVYLQKRYRFYDKYTHGYAIHTAIVTVVWGIFIGAEFLANKTTWRFKQTLPAPGLIIMGFGLALFVAAIHQIGTSALSNGNFFGRPLRNLKGIYQYIKEPIYWSYTIWFVGLAGLTGMKVFLLFALISIVGLIGFEARVEKPLPKIS